MLCCAVLTQVTVLFCDLTNFTSLCGQLHPAQVMLFLDALYSCLDGLCEEHKVYKVETIGDCFMVCGGLFSEGGGGGWRGPCLPRQELQPHSLHGSEFRLTLGSEFRLTLGSKIHRGWWQPRVC